MAFMAGRRNFLGRLVATAVPLVPAFGGLLAPAACAQSPALSPPPPLASEVVAPGWQRSWAAGTIDEAGHRMGGTEVMHLVVHRGRLYAGVGYWLDPRNVIYGGKSPKDFWAQILRLDGPDAHWRVDLDMPMHLRPEILKSVIFTTDGRGKALSAPVELLLAATYEIPRRGISLFTRDDDTGKWEKSKIIAGDTGLTGEDNSVRAMLVHRDAVTGIDRLFASVGVAGIYSGVYDPGAAGKIRWDRESRPVAWSAGYSPSSKRTDRSISPPIPRSTRERTDPSRRMPRSMTPRAGRAKKSSRPSAASAA